MATGQKPGPLSLIDNPIDIDDGTLARLATPTPVPTGTDASSVATLDILFGAFIPGALGASFESYDHPRDLKNQSTFDAALKAVSGTG